MKMLQQRIQPIFQCRLAELCLLKTRQTVSLGRQLLIFHLILFDDDIRIRVIFKSFAGSLNPTQGKIL